MKSHFFCGPSFFFSLNKGGWHTLSVLILDKPVLKIDVSILLLYDMYLHVRVYVTTIKFNYTIKLLQVATITSFLFLDR